MSDINFIFNNEAFKFSKKLQTLRGSDSIGESALFIKNLIAPMTIIAMGAMRAPKPPPRGGDQPIPACLAALLPGGRLQGRCLALSAAVEKYKPVTRRVAARFFVNFGAKIAITVKKRTGQILIGLQRK